MSSRSLPKGAPQPGAVFAEKYKVDRVLGVGGMGYVFAATHLHLHEPVAIKMLLQRSAEDRTVVERFLREGRAAVKIRSEHVVRVLDVDELPDHTPYMVMEYLEGVDLAELLAREIRLEPTRAVGYVLQALEAVAKAHALRMVHRDLKPSNLFLTQTDEGTDCIKVLDFGISKIVLHDADLAMTKTSDALGTPLYMSPEQLRNSRKVDERADLWALGVVLFELISGRPPFQAESFAELGALVLSGKTPSLVDAAPHVDPGLADVVAVCLRTETSERFVNAADLADALVPFGGSDARARANRIIRSVGMPEVRATRAVGRVLATTLPHQTPPTGGSSPALVQQVTIPLPSIAPSKQALAPARTTLSSSMESRAESAPLPRRTGLVALIALPLVAIAVIGGGVMAYLYRGGRDVGSSVPTVTADPSTAAVVSPRASEPLPSSGVSGASEAPTELPPAVVDAGRPSTHVKPAPKASSTAGPATPAIRVPPVSSSAPVKKCDPPFVIDANGTKRWKAECL